MVISDLSTHSAHYVTISELSDYWAVSRQQIHKWIDARMLLAIRLGKRLYRVPTQAALDFERQASLRSPTARDGEHRMEPPPRVKSACVNETLPHTIGLRRVTKPPG